MLLKYLIFDEEKVSFPSVVNEVEVSLLNDESRNVIHLIKENKIDRLVFVYREKDQHEKLLGKDPEAVTLHTIGLYVKPISIRKELGREILTYKGLSKVILTAVPGRIDVNKLDANDRNLYETIKHEIDDYFHCIKVSDNLTKEINPVGKAEIGDSTFVNMIRQAFSALEDMGESILINTPVTNKIYKLRDIINLQSRERDIRTFKLEDYPYTHLYTLLSFTKNLDKYWNKMRFFLLSNSTEQLQLISSITSYASKAIEVENQIQSKINENMSNQQKEYMLREKMKVIKNELDINEQEEENEYERIIKSKKNNKMYPHSVQKIIKEEMNKYSQMMASSPDANITRTYIETLQKLPWRKTEIDYLDIDKARKTLNKYHYGLDEVKERIIEHLAVILNNRKHNPVDKKTLISFEKGFEIDLNLFKEEKDKKQKQTFNNVPILALVGPPGTGKTSLSKAIAEALNKSFIKISLGGVHDESEIRGHRRTYVGAMPGKIVKGINKAGISNPLFLLDEIDKMASDIKGDPASAMLEVLDPEQNSRFQDHYLEHEYDLSKVMFIATANYYEDIPAPLIDRVEIIELSPYTISEKVKIARNHLLAKVIEQTSLTKNLFLIEDEVIKYIIKHYTNEAGVRALKRSLDKIARKIVVKIIDNPKLKTFHVTKDNLIDLLGIARYKEEEKEVDESTGTVTGLAYTSTGGSTLQIEVTTYPGKGEIKLTGQLKDVMQESAQIALTYVRANALKFGIKEFDFENSTIHIHVPEGAIPKDGPSAGVTFTTAIISALSKTPVKNIFGMTGEITLRGKVLEIGGLKEKSFAATQKGLDYIFIPYNNIKNLRDIPDEIKDLLTYIPVRKYDEIFEAVFNNKIPEFVINKENNKNISRF